VPDVQPKDHLHFAHLHGDVVAYGAPGHRHTGEIEHWLTHTPSASDSPDLGPVQFTPHLVPMARGLVTTSVALLADGVAADDVQAALQDAYANEAFVHVLPPGTFPHSKALHGSNGVQVSAVVDPRTHRVVVTTAEDNLGKGAAGQAIQNANLMLGLRSPSLSAIGVYPCPRSGERGRA
jgi:N-acetyl-gamma-glutamyl-phosphate reductase